MSNQSKKGTCREAYFAKYKTSKIYEANKKRKLERVLKSQPNNDQVKMALKDISFRKRKPKTRQWSASQIAIVKLFMLFSGRFDKAFFDKDVEKSIAAANVRNTSLVKKSNYKLANESRMFSLMARAHDGKGNLVWMQ